MSGELQLLSGLRTPPPGSWADYRWILLMHCLKPTLVASIINKISKVKVPSCMVNA